MSDDFISSLFLEQAFNSNNDNNKEIIYSCEIEADKIKKDIL